MQVISGILIFAVVITTVLGIGLLSLWKKSLHSRPLSMMVLSISLWALFIGLFLSGILETANGFFVPAYYATAGIAPIFALGFALSYSVRNRKNSIIKRLFEIVVYTISCVAVVAFCFFPNWLLKSIDSTNLTVELGFHANVIYTVFFALICLLTAIFLTVNMIRTRRKAVKHGLKKVLIVWVIGGVLGSISNLLLPFFGDYSLIWVAPLLIMALMIPMSSTLVATVEHFSLPKTFFRGFIYFVFVSVSTFIIFSASQIVSYLDFASKSDIERFMKISVSLMVLTPIIFLLFWAMRKAVKKLDSDGFDENMVLTSMSHIVASKHTPSEFLAIVRHELVRFFGVRQADVIVFEHNTATHLKGNALKSALIRLTSGQKNQNKHHTIYCEDIKNKTDYAIIKSCDIEVIVPIVGAIDGNAVGAIVLSPRKRRYDRQYGETLERVSIIISPYIQSASFYEQILGYNDKLRADVRRKTQKLRLSYEELAEANERKSEALHTASHNLRTPLTGVNGMISMVLDGDTGKINKETQKYLEIALQSGQAMNQVISTVLTASNIEAGKFELKKDKFNLTDAVKDEVSALRKNASEKGIKLSFYSDKKPIIIIGDESRIRQAVVNFVDNAIYYGNSKIEVSLHRVKGKIVFKVEDDGIGVPADEQDKIFDKMFRASNADVHRADGTGFGLYVTKKTIELSGGKVIFQSTEGEGSIFGFEY